MTCLEARDRFSELVDERLTPDERSAVAAHLSECAACRHELERFQATVALIRSTEPARAPVGFVDRVLAAAGSTLAGEAERRSRWRRLVDAAFSPLPRKLPLEAAAILLVGLGVAYLWERTPELQQATRVEPPAVTDRDLRKESPATSDVPTSKSDSARIQSATPPAPRSDASPTGPAESAQRQQDAVPERKPDAAPEMKRKAPVAGEVPPAADKDVQASRAASPEGERRDATEAARAPQERSAGAAAEAPPAASAPAPSFLERRVVPRRETAPQLASASLPDVIAALEVGSRSRAVETLREVIARRHGAVIAAREESRATVIELRIPRDEYVGFVTDLSTIGRWRTERVPTELPPDVRMTIRLTD